MRIYRKIIPKIAQDIIRNLSNKEFVEISSNAIEEAELDIAAILVEYQNAEDSISKEARKTLTAKGMSPEHYFQIKKNIANMRGLKIGVDGLDYIIEQILEGLYISKNIEEIFAEDYEIKKIIKSIINKYMNISDDIDLLARKRLKNIKEGTPEWEIEYPRIILQLRRQKGLV